MRLQGRAALITGAGSGIGRAATELFSSEGAGVAILDRDAPAAGATASSISTMARKPIRWSPTCPHRRRFHVQSPAPPGFSHASTSSFNNAGIAPSGSVLDANEDDWDRCYAVNVKGKHLTSRTAIPHLQAAGGGSIINQASVAALVGTEGLAAYSAAKGAVVSMTRASAMDLAPLRIRVNAICPGVEHTPIMERLMWQRGGGSLERGLETTAAKHPIERVATPMDIAGAALLLASDDAAFVTGATLTVDGGMTAR